MEVLRKLEPDQQSQTHGHVRIAAEIEVDLQGIGQQAAPGAGQAGRCLGKTPVGHGRHGIRQQHLLGQPQDEQRAADARLGPAVRAHPQLIVQLVVPHDRPGHQLREQGDIAGEIDEAPRGAGLPAVEIEGIAHRLERVERNAHRQHEVQQGDQVRPAPQPAGHRVGCLCAQVVVLEKGQHAHVAADGDQQPALFLRRIRRGRDAAAGQIVDGDGQQQQPAVAVVPPAVEDETAQRQPAVPPALRQQQVIAGQHHRQQAKQEFVGIEQHLTTRRSPCALLPVSTPPSGPRPTPPTAT